MGKPKASSAFGDGVDDIYTMRSHEWNSKAASVFGDMKLDDLAFQYRSISKSLLTPDGKLSPEVAGIIRKTASDPDMLLKKIEKRAQSLSDLSKLTDFLLSKKESLKLTDEQIDDAGMRQQQAISKGGKRPRLELGSQGEEIMYLESKIPKETNPSRRAELTRELLGLYVNETLVSNSYFPQYRKNINTNMARKFEQKYSTLLNTIGYNAAMDKMFFDRNLNDWRQSHWLILLHGSNGEMR